MTIAVYGATGHLGSLVTRELGRSGVDVVVSGRNREKLERVVRQYHGMPMSVASIDDPVALRSLLDGCDVVVNCAGPPSLCGEPLVRAALDTGTHYADSGGDQAFIRHLFEQYGPTAERRCLALVPAGERSLRWAIKTPR